MKKNTGWQSKEAVSHYKNVADILIPGREDVLKIIAQLATDFNKDNLQILDIGCGYGDVTAEIMKINPDISFSLIDYSKEMVNMCNERFHGNRKVTVYEYDLNNGLPSDLLKESQYDIIVSCFSLHHIEYENRVKLYKDFNKVLKKGSLFINGDMFICDSEKLNKWEFDGWISWMVKKIKENFGQDKTFEEVKKKQLDNFKLLGDKPGKLCDMYNDLRKAGFITIDIMLKMQNLAVVVASKGI